MTEQESVSIRVESVSKTYRKRGGGAVRAVDDVTLFVEPGQTIGLLGLAGAGKTTLLKIVGGAIQPTSGRVRVNGHDLARERRLVIGEIDATLRPWPGIDLNATAWNHLTHSSPESAADTRWRERAERVLRHLSLWAQRDMPLSELPALLQKRVVLARALLVRRSVVLLDDLFLGLGREPILDVKDSFSELVREPPKMIVMTLSNLDAACELCDRVVLMERGRVVAECRGVDLDRFSSGVCYQIKVKEQVSRHWFAPFEAYMTMTQTGDETILWSNPPDQAALQGLLARVRDLGLTLISVDQTEPDFHQVFDGLHGHPVAVEPA